MASETSDAWLWVGLTVMGYYAAMAVRKQLAGIRKDSQISHYDFPKDMINQRTVNAIKLDTLDQLTHSPNLDIRTASIKIITERLFRVGSTWALLLQDIKGLNTERRDKALMTLRFVAQYVSEIEEAPLFFHQPEFYDTLIICLNGLLPEAQLAESNSSYRSQAEGDSLWLLNHVLPHHTLPPQMAIEANIIGRWLIIYPFGGWGATLAEKKDIMRSIVEGEYFYEDSDFGYSMQSVLACFFKLPAFREQLDKHGLLDMVEDSDDVFGVERQFAGGERHGTQRAWERVPEGAVRTSNGWNMGTVYYPDDSDPDENLPGDVPEGAIRTSGGYYVRAHTRGMEQSPEEQALRRRRREAMVLGENGRPIQRQDIIERNPFNPDRDNVDDALEPLMERISSDAAEGLLVDVRIGNDRGWLGWWGWIRRIRPDGLAPVYP